MKMITKVQGPDSLVSNFGFTVWNAPLTYESICPMTILIQIIEIIGALTHSMVIGISRGKFSRSTSHLGFSIPWFQQLHANSSFPK